jgi:hypothetical protein
LDSLNAQTETINSIHKNLGIFNEKLDVSDHKLKQIVNPLIKHKKTQTSQPTLIENNFTITGRIKKYTKTFKKWYYSQCTLERDRFIYQRLVKPSNISVNLQDCTFKYINKGDTLYDGSICKYNDVLEITEIMYLDGEVNYHAFRTSNPRELDTYINYLIHYSGHQIEGIKSNTAACDKETKLLDILHSKLDKLSVLSETMNTVVREHTDNIRIISDTMDNSYKRTIEYSDKTKTLR